MLLRNLKACQPTLQKSTKWTRTYIKSTKIYIYVYIYKQLVEKMLYLFIWGFTALSTTVLGHITTGSWKARGNQYIQLVKVLYCKLPTNDKQLPAFPFEAVTGTEPRPRRWEARVLPLCHHGPEQNVAIIN